MTANKTIGRILPLLREYGLLERKRASDGVTPLEYQRWRDLKDRLGKHIPQGAPPTGVERRRHLRVPSRILVQYQDRSELREAVIGNISRGGLFIHTPFGPDIGTSIVLLIRVDETGENLEVPCEVVSTNVSNGFATDTLGMGVRFGQLSAAQRKAVDQLFGAALDLGRHGDAEA